VTLGREQQSAADEALHSFRELDPETVRRRGPVASGAPLLQVRELSVSFATRTVAPPRHGRREGTGERRRQWRGDRRGALRAVQGVDFELARGEVLALVGESGSGKSVCAMTLMGLTRGPLSTISGSARLDGEELLAMSDAQLRRVRGRRMAMIFQDPQSSLNPVHRVGDQIAEQIRAHEPLVSRRAALDRARELMERVSIPRAAERVRAYPHELSGGQRQRVMIAMALSLGAPLLLADEPTTALDVTVQAQILTELGQLREEENLGIVLITHDFAIVAAIADRIAVMRAGRIVEQGPVAQVLGDPADAYTRELLDALASRPRRPRSAAAERAPALLEVEGLRVTHRGSARRGRQAPTLDGIELRVDAGETLAVVGESGCGKTTLLRSIAGLLRPDAGTVRFDGGLGMVFQDPQSSLNPRRRAGATLERAVRRSIPHSGHTAGSCGGRRAAGHGREQAAAEALRLLRRVGLDREHAERYPHELSGGQRQRVAIARALAGAPRLVLLDEPVSSLDASLRRGVIELLEELQAELGCAYVVVSHDLGAVEATADRIAVMHDGRIVELGAAERVLREPQHPYTRELLAARPRTPARARPADRVVSSSLWSDSESSPPSPGDR
jgi:peptide/nickel transport system ATP-binding protein